MLRLEDLEKETSIKNLAISFLKDNKELIDDIDELNVKINVKRQDITILEDDLEEILEDIKTSINNLEVFNLIFNGNTNKKVSTVKVPKESFKYVKIADLKLKGSSYKDIKDIIYPNKELSEDLKFLIERQLSEAEKADLIKITKKSVMKDKKVIPSEVKMTEKGKEFFKL